MKNKNYDVVIISDLRFHGGCSFSNAESARAQSAAGYKTAFIHHPSWAIEKARPFNRAVLHCIQAGFADLVPFDQPVKTRLLIIRSPRVFGPATSLPPWIEAGVKVLIVNLPPFSADEGKAVFDVASLRDAVGRDCLWAPNGPRVREQLIRSGVPLNLTEKDWYNIVTLDEWKTDRSDFVADRPVIGRHTRDSVDKWPDKAADILGAYPADERFVVKILGGAGIPRKILGSLPANWKVYPFDSSSPKEFLRGIDFLVYFHHPQWVEAFGRVIMEGLATGAPVIAPHHFEPLFKDSCVYARPAEVADAVLKLYGDKEAYLAQSERGLAFARENCSAEYHVNKVRELIGAPSASPSAARPAPSAPPRKKVLFITSNGGGMGHITRTMAIARRLSPDVKPVFLTLSQALPEVRKEGFFAEYFAECMDYSDRPAWDILFNLRIREVIKMHNPAAVVLDASSSYVSLVQIIETDAGRAFVWCRRAMWKKEKKKYLLTDSGSYDLVIEPGELAEAYDVGCTVSERHRAANVGPIVFLDESELLERADAARELGLDPARPAVLIQLGSGRDDDVATPTGLFVRELSRVAGLQIAVAKSVLSHHEVELPACVKSLSVYPMSKYFRAFDFAVGAPGYNTFHELIRFGVPAIHIPMVNKNTDNQAARARYAAEAGVGLCLEEVNEQNVKRCVGIMLDEKARRKMSDACRGLAWSNGAEEAARLVESLMRSRDGRKRTMARNISEMRNWDGVTKKKRFFPALVAAKARRLASRVVHSSKRDVVTALKNPRWAAGGVLRVLKKKRVAAPKKELRDTILVIACGASAAQLDSLVEQMESLRLMLASDGVRVIFVTDRDYFRPFRRLRYCVECIPPESEWIKHGNEPQWGEFKDMRIRGIIEAYKPSKIIFADDIENLQSIRKGLANELFAAKA